jgi:hypothetical protein
MGSGHAAARSARPKGARALPRFGLMANCSSVGLAEAMRIRKTVQGAKIFLKPGATHAECKSRSLPAPELARQPPADGLRREFPMSKPSDSSLPADVCLLLRADAEQRWLHREVIPVLREVEARGGVDEQQADAALAYLEAMWKEARIRARATDAVHAALDCEQTGKRALSRHAGRYHAAVCVLRQIVAARVAPLVEVLGETRGMADDAQGSSLLRQAPGAGGCEPQAA